MYWTWVLVLLSILSMSGGQLLLKKGLLIIGRYPGSLSDLPWFFFKAFTSIYVLSAIFLMVISALSWMIALSKSQLSYIYPLSAFSYIIIAAFSAIIFKEHITLLRGAGIAVICLGIYLVLRS
jgi:drug/metabolite transporter (DMT)-like permease